MIILPRIRRHLSCLIEQEPRPVICNMGFTAFIRHFHLVTEWWCQRECQTLTHVLPYLASNIHQKKNVHSFVWVGCQYGGAFSFKAFCTGLGIKITIESKIQGRVTKLFCVQNNFWTISSTMPGPISNERMDLFLQG